MRLVRRLPPKTRDGGRRTTAIAAQPSPLSIRATGDDRSHRAGATHTAPLQARDHCSDLAIGSAAGATR